MQDTNFCRHFPKISNKHFPVLLQMLHAVTLDPYNPFKREGLEAETALSSYPSRVKVMCSGSGRAWMGVSPATCCTASQTNLSRLYIVICQSKEPSALNDYFWNLSKSI